MFVGFARTIRRNGLADTPSLQLCDVAMSCPLGNDLRWKFAGLDFRETLQRTRFFVIHCQEVTWMGFHYDRLNECTDL